MARLAVASPRRRRPGRSRIRLKQAHKLPEQQRSRIAQQQDAVDAMSERLSAARRQYARQEKLVKDQLADENDLDAISEDHVKELEAMLRGEKNAWTI